MNTLLRAAALLAVLALGANSTAPQEPVRLRLQFEAGECLRYRMTQVQTMESELLGTIATTSSMVFRQEVASVAEDGTASLGLRYEAVKMDMDGPAAMSFDSTRTGEEAKKNDARLAKVFGPMLEARLGMTIEPSGRVTEITGFKELLEAALSGVSEGGNAEVGEMLKELLSEDALRKMVEINVFPAEPLAPGASWKRSLDQKIPMFGNLKVELDNTFAGTEEHAGSRCARIDVAGKLTFEKSAEPSPIPVEVSIASPALAGTMYFALERGRFLEMRLETSMDMHFSAKVEGGGGFEMEMGMTTGQTLRLLNKDEPAFE